MAITFPTHRRPQPSPITTPADALDALMIATADGTQPTAVFAFMDRNRRPLAMFVVDDCRCTTEEVMFLVDFLCGTLRAPTLVDSVIVATSCPGRSPEPTPVEIDLWPTLVSRFAAVGVILRAWYVLADGAARVIAPGGEG